MAGPLVALDGLNVVMSRVAMLDIHLSFWVVLGFLCLVLDRRWIDVRRRRSPAGPGPHAVTVVGEDGSDDGHPGRAGAVTGRRVPVAAVAPVAVRAPGWLWAPRAP